MSKAAFYILIYYLLVSNTVLTNTFAQSPPLEETPEQSSDNSIDSETAADKKEKGATIFAPKPKTAASGRISAKGIDSTSLASREETTDPRPTRYRIVRLIPLSEISKPSSGTGHIVGGTILFGLGVFNLAFIPLCYVLFDDDSYSSDRGNLSRDVCVLSSLSFGGVMVAVGVPLLIVGVNKRSDYNKWRKKNSVVDRF